MDVKDEEILALSWDNYAKQFHDKLSQLWHKERFTDATITCEGKFYSVHKIVLSTCSQFFERVFEYTVGKHPVVVLPDVKQYELEALLKFMYDGVLQIARKDLPRLMKVADLLKIRSLCGPEEWTADDVSSRDNHANAVDKMSLPKVTRPLDVSGSPTCNKKRKLEEERATATYATQTFAHHPHAYEIHKTQETYQTATLRIPGEAVPLSELSRELPHDNLGSLKSIATSVMGFETDRQYHHEVHEANIAKETEVNIKNEFMDDVSNSQNAAVTTEVEDDGREGNASGESFLPQQPDLTELSQAEAVHPLSEDIAGPSGVHEDVQLQAAVEVVMGVAEGEEEESLYTHSPQSAQWEAESTPTTGRTTKKNQARQGTVNYTCPFCNKLFLDKFKCSRHMYAHTGEKPFICNICARRFSRKDNLQKHMKDKHKLFRGQF
ncbi:zinc finger and BTB domain-containing protein 17-like isoform X1 [Macrobrachium rosenbergii]|uniref:zinc finger and BTB domain-containing protein 17-like isoform X1 n=1 Tax=Macrobrachium rosenbergii TaxID=79674 RepID=UPI0034D5E65A